MAVGHSILDGRYEIVSILGEGGMGRAFLAQDHKYEAPVVIKAMHQRFIHDIRFHELFTQEMEFLSQFQHPNVVSLLKTGVDPMLGPFLVMEYLDGRPLGDILDETPVIPVRRVGKLLVQLCKALQAAHNRGIIHRDIKPNNMMIIAPAPSQERLKVLDFGLAKLAAAPHLTLEDLKGQNRNIRAVGTPEYMNPEQMRGNEVDHRADFYSVGVLLYEMLTGRRPFDHPKEQELMGMHLKAAPPTFKEAGLAEGSIKPGVEQVVMACLSKYPMDRPRDARELAVRFMAGLGEKLNTSDFEEPLTSPARAGNSPSALDIALNNNKDSVQLEAWMPESIAVLKLCSFLLEFHGEVSESIPGLVRCKLWVGGPPSPPPSPSLFVKFKLVKPPEPPPAPPQAQLDLYMLKKDNNDNRLNITVVLHKPGECPPWLHSKWKPFHDSVVNGLCSHLMATRVK
ncbi:MAG: serine/threonine-protein kinase [Gemmatales bacterium]